MSKPTKATDPKPTKAPIPATMRAAIIEEYGKPIIVKKIPVPKPKHGQVLLEMESAALNPSDVIYAQGKYGIKNPTPYTIGLEGSGRVVASGGGLLGWYLLGKRAAVITTTSTIGTWAEYCVSMDKQVIPIPDKTSFDQASGYFVNPLTAIAFHEYCKNGKHKAAVFTAGCSAVARMTMRFLKRDGIKIIAVVRREEQVLILKSEEKLYHVVKSDDFDYLQQFKDLVKKYKPTIMFDALGGDQMWELFKQMPNFSECYIYGHLSNKPTNNMDASHLIFANKKIHGFYLGDWIRTRSLYDRFWMNEIAKNETTGVLKIKHVKRFPLERANEAMKFYVQNMSLGKVCIRPKL